MPWEPHGYKVNQTHKVSLRGGGLGHWAAGQSYFDYFYAKKKWF
jgi:hypothetical protein